MRRIIVAIALLLLVSGSCIFENYYINTSFKKETKLLSQMEKELISGNKEKALKISQNIEKEWNTTENILCHFLSSSALDKIGIEVSKLPHIIKDTDFLTRMTKRKIEVMLQNIKESEQYTIF